MLIDDDVRREISQLIQDYFLWAFENPEEAAQLCTMPSLQQGSKARPSYSDLLGFARWLAESR
jgi:hypothetical protein